MKLTPKEKKALAVVELWYRGDLSFKLHSAQMVIDDAYNKIKNQLFVGLCARQFGKTWWASVKAIEQAIRKPNSEIRYGAAHQVDLKKYIIPTFNKIMEDCPETIKGKYKSNNSYVFPNGSIVYLVGLDLSPDGLRGASLDLVCIDEAAFVTNLDYIYKSVIIPSTTHRADCKIILISSPPSTPDHDFLIYISKAQLENGYVLFTIYDNPMIDQETINRLQYESGGSESSTWRREYLAELITDANSAIIPEWRDGYVQDVPKDEYYPFYHKYESMDLGVKDFTAILFGYYDFMKATLVIEDELHLNGPELITPTLVDKIKEKELQVWNDPGNPKLTYRRVADNNNLLLLQDMSSIYKLSFTATDKESLEAMINKVRVMVTQGRIIVKPNCEKLIGCLKYGVWDNKKKAFNRSPTYGHYDHLAALIYLVRNLDTRTNPIPATYNYIPEETWNYKTLEQRNNNRNLAKAIIPKIKHPNSFRR